MNKVPKTHHPTREPDPLCRPRLERSIGFNIARHLSQSKKPQDAEADRLGVGRDEWRLLLALHEYGAQPSAQLVRLTFLDRAVVSRAVGRLERDGRVTRFSDANDRRVSIIKLTQTGEQIASEVAKWHFQRDAAIASALTEEELRLWISLNDKLYRRLLDVRDAHDAEP